jgi:DNA-binding MarR family transcriptional regulator
MELNEIQESLLALLPQWNYRIAKPLKQHLDRGVSLEMYYCIQIIRYHGGEMTMTELAQIMRIPRHQMTKMADRIVDNGFAERVKDPDDRRIIKLKMTQKALQYIDDFLTDNQSCFEDLFDSMDDNDQENFKQAIDTLTKILRHLPQQTTHTKKHNSL